MKIRFGRGCSLLLALAVSVGVLLTGCGGTTPLETHSITGMTLKSGDIIKRTAVSGKKDSFELVVNSLNKDDGQYIEWVSTKPEVAKIDPGDPYKLYSEEVFHYIASIDYCSRGTTEIYARTTDGKIESNRIKVTNGRPDDDCHITGLSINLGKNSVWMDSDEKSLEIPFYYFSDYVEDTSTIQWISTNPQVATIAGNTGNYIMFKGMMQVVSEGETTVYAQTADGGIVSNQVKITIGNQYNKEEAARNDVEEMVFKKLKYNSIQKDALLKLRPYYFLPNIWYHRGALKAVYTTYTDLSTVTSSGIEFSGQDATVRGYAKTFNDNAIGVTLNFVIHLHYSDDFTQYTVVSESYDMPELIRASIG